MSELSVTDLLIIIGLIVLGGAILITEFPEAIEDYQVLGLAPLGGGILFLVGKVTGKL